MKLWLRGAVLAAVSAAVLLGSRAGSLWWSADRQRGPDAEGSAEVAVLGANVEIARDPFGIPHVQARSEADAWIGLGFAHAQDRLAQMELLRRSAQGRLSEVLGAAALDGDRLARLLGLARASEREAEQLSPPSLALLEAYCAGVNAWLERLARGQGPVPRELEWTGVWPEPWRPADVLAIVRWRAWSSARSLGSALLLDRLVRELGGVPAREFFPVRASDGAHDALALLRLGRAADTLAAAGGLAERAGSLGFVIGGTRAAGGMPLLANDPHVSLDLPAPFYLAHLRAPGFELAGATWPGVPVFWTGSNRSAAWGQVALHASVSDLYEETFLPGDPPRYERNGRWQRAALRVERIAVRGREPVRLEIARTRSGPSLAPLLAEAAAGGRGLTLRWIGFGAPSGIESLLRVQRAQGWEEFREALRELAVPAATFLYADRAGEIGLQVAGRLPARGVDTDLLPASGAQPHYRWRGSLPFEELPSQHGTDLPFLVASTHPPELEPRVSWLWSSPGAAERLRRRLAEASGLELADVVELQAERRSERGPQDVRRLLADSAPSSRAAQRVLEELRGWDGDTHAGSRGAALYHVFRQQLGRRILAQRLPAGFARELADLAEPAPGLALARFLDRQDAAESAALSAAALEDTWSFMRAHVDSNPAKWTWAATRSVRLRHALERSAEPRLRWLGRRLGSGPLAVGGDPDSVWSMHHGPLPGDGLRVGPGLRFAIDLADPDHAQFGLAGGQSGFAGDPHYTDALADWLAGRARPLWMHRADLAYHRRGVWELRPGGS